MKSIQWHFSPKRGHVSPLTLDDSQILAGSFSVGETGILEQRLMTMLLLQAKKEGKKIVAVNDPELYQRLAKSGELFGGEAYYIPVDPASGRLSDARPIAAYLIDTPEGLLYGKIILSSGSRPS
ncbi:hypothetical protein HYU14_07165 [Candidatus Woesearchaeota archaeon]|nr:hypothetical protein [Candidatus Woesearchaeota archaeon]